MPEDFIGEFIGVNSKVTNSSCQIFETDVLYSSKKNWTLLLAGVILFKRMPDTRREVCKVGQCTVGLQAAGWVQLMIRYMVAGGQCKPGWIGNGGWSGKEVTLLAMKSSQVELAHILHGPQMFGWTVGILTWDHGEIQCSVLSITYGSVLCWTGRWFSIESSTHNLYTSMQTVLSAWAVKQLCLDHGTALNYDELP